MFHSNRHRFMRYFIVGFTMMNLVLSFQGVGVALATSHEMTHSCPSPSFWNGSTCQMPASSPTPTPTQSPTPAPITCSEDMTLNTSTNSCQPKCTSPSTYDWNTHACATAATPTPTPILSATPTPSPTTSTSPSPSPSASPTASPAASPTASPYPSQSPHPSMAPCPDSTQWRDPAGVCQSGTMPHPSPSYAPQPSPSPYPSMEPCPVTGQWRDPATHECQSGTMPHPSPSYSPQPSTSPSPEQPQEPLYPCYAAVTNTAGGPAAGPVMMTLAQCGGAMKHRESAEGQRENLQNLIPDEVRQRIEEQKALGKIEFKDLISNEDRMKFKRFHELKGKDKQEYLREAQQETKDWFKDFDPTAIAKEHGAGEARKLEEMKQYLEKATQQKGNIDAKELGRARLQAQLRFGEWSADTATEVKVQVADESTKAQEFAQRMEQKYKNFGKFFQGHKDNFLDAGAALTQGEGLRQEDASKLFDAYGDNVLVRASRLEKVGNEAAVKQRAAEESGQYQRFASEMKKMSQFGIKVDADKIKAMQEYAKAVDPKLIKNSQSVLEAQRTMIIGSEVGNEFEGLVAQAREEFQGRVMEKFSADHMKRGEKAADVLGSLVTKKFEGKNEVAAAALEKAVERMRSTLEAGGDVAEMANAAFNQAKAFGVKESDLQDFAAFTHVTVASDIIKAASKEQQTMITDAARFVPAEAAEKYNAFIASQDTAALRAFATIQDRPGMRTFLEDVLPSLDAERGSAAGGEMLEFAEAMDKDHVDAVVQHVRSVSSEAAAQLEALREEMSQAFEKTHVMPPSLELPQLFMDFDDEVFEITDAVKMDVRVQQLVTDVRAVLKDFPAAAVEEDLAVLTADGVVIYPANAAFNAAWNAERYGIALAVKGTRAKLSQKDGRNVLSTIFSDASASAVRSAVTKDFRGGVTVQEVLDTCTKLALGVGAKAPSFETLGLETVTAPGQKITSDAQFVEIATKAAEAFGHAPPAVEEAPEAE